MPSGLEGHTLPAVIWEGCQQAIKLHKSPFSPQLHVQGPLNTFKLFLVTFCVHPDITVLLCGAFLKSLNTQTTGRNLTA